jgi:hypothetical protein
MRRWLVPFWVLGLLLALPAGGCRIVTIEVSTAAGVRPVISSASRAARPTISQPMSLAREQHRRGPRGDRMSLVGRWRVQVRGRATITVGGRPVSWPAGARPPATARAERSSRASPPPSARGPAGAGRGS